MFIDYLDPFWPVRDSRPPVDPVQERTDTSSAQPRDADRDLERSDAYREDRSTQFDDYGETIDTYA